MDVDNVDDLPQATITDTGGRGHTLRHRQIRVDAVNDHGVSQLVFTVDEAHRSPPRGPTGPQPLQHDYARHDRLVGVGVYPRSVTRWRLIDEGVAEGLVQVLTSTTHPLRGPGSGPGPHPLRGVKMVSRTPKTPPRRFGGVSAILRYPGRLEGSNGYVREGGLEPPPPLGDTALNRARLPVPPLSR